MVVAHELHLVRLKHLGVQGLELMVYQNGQYGILLSRFGVFHLLGCQGSHHIPFFYRVVFSVVYAKDINHNQLSLVYNISKNPGLFQTAIILPPIHKNGYQCILCVLAARFWADMADSVAANPPNRPYRAFQLDWR